MSGVQVLPDFLWRGERITDALSIGAKKVHCVVSQLQRLNVHARPASIPPGFYQWINHQFTSGFTCTSRKGNHSAPLVSKFNPSVHCRHELLILRSVKGTKNYYLHLTLQLLHCGGSQSTISQIARKSRMTKLSFVNHKVSVTDSNTRKENSVAGQGERRNWKQ
jgi:hypothetical protein